MLLLFAHISISRLSECWSFQAGWCIHHLSQLLVLLSIKAINALLTWVITESHVSKYPPHRLPPTYLKGSGFHRRQMKRQWQFIFVVASALPLMCSFFPYEMRPVLLTNAFRGKVQYPESWACHLWLLSSRHPEGVERKTTELFYPKSSVLCVFNTRFPTISAKSYCNKIYNIISKIAYIET